MAGVTQRREVLIVLEDVVEHSKMAGISQKPGAVGGSVVDASGMR